MKKIAAGVLPVLALYLVQEFLVPFETLQLWVALATLPVSVVFLAKYTPEKPWQHWFGTSLLLLAVGVFLYCLTVILFRTCGDYPGRPFMVTSSVGLIFTSMVMRTWVLLDAQRRGRSLVHRH